MFDITASQDGAVHLVGRLDSANAQQAQAFFENIADPSVVDFSELEYISSAGLRVLIAAQKKLASMGKKMRLVHMNSHIREVFRIANFHILFDIDEG